MAVSALYVKTGTALTWKETGGEYTFTPKNISNGAGRIGARGDLGAYPRSSLYRYFAATKCQATPTQYNLIKLFLAFWDDESTPGDPDGASGSTDAAWSTETDALNLTPLRPIICDAASSSKVFTSSGLIRIRTRYVSPWWWNASGAALTNTAGDHFFRLTPYYPEAQ